MGNALITACPKADPCPGLQRNAAPSPGGVFFLTAALSQTASPRRRALGTVRKVLGYIRMRTPTHLSPLLASLGKTYRERAADVLDDRLPLPIALALLHMHRAEADRTHAEA